MTRNKATAKSKKEKTHTDKKKLSSQKISRKNVAEESAVKKRKFRFKPGTVAMR